MVTSKFNFNKYLVSSKTIHEMSKTDYKFCDPLLY